MNQRTRANLAARRCSRRRGNAILEAALVLTVLLPLAFGSAEFGLFFYIKHTMQGAAREGARAGIVKNATNAEVAAAVNTFMQAAGYTSDKYTLAITDASNAPVDVNTLTAGSPVKVRVECTWGTVGVNMLGTASPLSPTKKVAGVMVMRKE